MSYCSAVRNSSLGDEHVHYHDHEYGFPLRDDNGLFERLVLEINQAGLSWTTILRKRAGFQKAYEGFVLERVAAYGEADEARLLSDPAIIRNRLKVKAASENARRILEIRRQHGSFAAWLDQHHPRPKEDWVKLFKKTFVFTGGEIVGEFLLSTGYLPGAHDEVCPVQRRIHKLKPAWMSRGS
jgi:DNA-3-methyladenine glycosylase I